MKNRFAAGLITLVALLALAPAAFAQATRTWVSGVGDDANPCSRTAPCKTFAGAISKTAPGGEINVLDPGGFGAVTITKSITISSEGFEAGVLVSGTNGIVVSAAASDIVILRGLDIEGLGTGLDGIKILTAGSVHVEKCTIHNFTGAGINAAAGRLYVRDTIIRDNLGAGATTSGGILINGAAQASLDNVRLDRNSFGLRAQGTASVQVRDSVAAGCNTNGFQATGAGVSLTLINVESVTNTTGVNADTSAQVRLTGCTITGNGTGVSITAGGTVTSLKNDLIDGNIGGNNIVGGSIAAITVQ